MGETPGRPFAVEAACCALLIPLPDAWTLWEVVAEAGYPGRSEAGRHATLPWATAAGDYRPHVVPPREERVRVACGRVPTGRC